MADNRKEYVIGLLFDTDDAYKQIKDFESEFGKLDRETKAYIKSEFEARIKGIKSAAKAARDNPGNDTFVAALAEDVEALKGAMKKLQGLFPDEEWAKGGKTISGVFADMDRQISGIVDTTGKLDKSIKELRQSFELTFGNNSGLVDMSKYSKKVLETMTRIKSVTKKGNTQSFLDDLIQKHKELEDLELPNVSSMGLDELEQKIDEVQQKWDKFNREFKGNRRTSPEYSFEQGKMLKEQMHYMRAYDKLYKRQNSNRDFYGADAYDDLENIINRIVSRFEDSITRLKAEINSKSFAAKLSEQLTHLEVQLDVDEASKDKLRDTVNGFIKELNEGPIEKIKVKIDNTLDAPDKDIVGTKTFNKDQEIIDKQIEDAKTKLDELRQSYAKVNQELGKLKENSEHQPRKKGEADAIAAQIKEQEELLANLSGARDSSMQHSVASIIRGLDQVDSVIETKTSKWREKIVDALNVKREEIHIPFSVESSANAIYIELQKFFDENEINIRLNKDIIAQQLKQAVEEGGLPLGGTGGTVAFDEKSLAMAVATGLQAFFTGDFTPVTGEKKKVADPTEPKKDKPLFLDPNNAYNKEIAEMFRGIVDYAQKKGAPSKKVAGFLDAKLVGTEFWNETTKSANLEKLAKASSADLIEVLGHMTDKYGKTLADDFGTLIGKTKNKLLSNFQSDLKVLLNTQNIGQTTISEDNKSRERQKMWDDYVTRSSLKTGLGKLYANPDDLKIPEFDELTNMQETAKELYGKDSDIFKVLSQQIETLKVAREKVKDVNDDNQKAEFLKDVEKFNNATNSIFVDLRNYLSEFEWGIEIKGFKNPFKVAGGYIENLLKAIDGDMSKIVTPHLYRAPESVSAYVENRPDRTDILNKEINVREFKTREGIEKEIAEAEALLVEAKNNKDEAQILTQQVRIANLKKQQKQLPNVSKRWEEENKALNTANEHNAEAEKRIAESEQSVYTQKQKSLEEKQSQIQADITAREESIKAEEQAIANLNVDGRKVAGARKRLQNKENALREANAEYVRLEQEGIKAQEELEIARLNQNVANTGDYKRRDELTNSIAKYEARLADPSSYNDEFKGDLQYKRDKSGEYSKLVGGIYQETYNRAYSNIKDYVEKINEKSTEISKNQNEQADVKNEIRRLENLTKKGGKFEGNANLLKQLEDAQLKLQRLQKDEELLNQTVEVYQQQIDNNRSQINDMLRKRGGRTKKDRDDFTRDVKAYIQKRLDEQKAEQSQLGEDPRIVANERVRQAESVVNEIMSQVNTAKQKLDKAQQEVNALNDDDLIKQAKEYDEHQKKLHKLKEQNEDDKKELDDINDSLSEMDKNPPASTATKLVTQDASKEIDEALEKANQTEEKLRQHRKEAKTIDEFVNKTLDSKEYKSNAPTYDIKRTDEDKSLFDDDLKHTLKSQYLNKVSEVAKSLDINKALQDKLDKDKDVTDKVLKQEAQDAIAQDKDGSKPLDETTREYYTKIVKEGRSAATKWLKETLEATYQNTVSQMEDIKATANNDSQMAKSLDENTKTSVFTAIDSLKDINSVSRLFKANDFGFSKFASEDDIKSEADRRLKDTSVTLSPIISEYYGKIIADGKEAATNWFIQELEKQTTETAQKIQSIQSIADTESSASKDLQPKLQEADLRLKQTYQDRVSSWFEDIQKKIELVDSNTLSDQESALVIKEIETLFGFIDKATFEYVKNFKESNREQIDALDKKLSKKEITKAEYDKQLRELNEAARKKSTEELLGGNQGLLDKRDNYLYADYKNKNVNADIASIDTISESIKNSERYVLLQTRQAELLRDIADPANSEKLTQLQEDLGEINKELAKYQQFIETNSNANLYSIFSDDENSIKGYKDIISDIVGKSQNLDLLKQQGVSEDKLDAQYKELNEAYAKRDKFVYDELTKRQTSLIQQIESDTKAGKSTTSSVKELEKINKELLDLEVNKRRVEQLGVSGSLYKANEQTVNAYNNGIKEQIKLEQELAILKAQGLKTDEKSNELRQHTNKLNKEIAQLQADRMNSDAAASPYIYAMRELIKLEKQYQLALQQRYAIKGRRKGAENQLDDVKNDEYYSTSWQYKKHLDAVKSEETTNYRYSEQYQTDRAKGMELALEETFKKVEETVRTAVENEYKAVGKSIDDAVIQKEIDEIVAQRVGKTKYLLGESLKKDGSKIDPKKFPEETGFYLATGGWDDLRGTIDESFEGSDEYKALIEKRTQARKLALEKEIAAINKESNEIIASITSASEETDAEMWAKISKRMTHLDRINPGVFSSEAELEGAARRALISEQEARARTRVSKMQGKFDADKFYADKDTEKKIREDIDDAFGRYIHTALKDIDKNAFNQMGLKDSGALQDITETLKDSMEKYVYNLVSDYRAKLEAQGGVITTVDGRERNVRQEVIDGLTRQIYGGEVELEDGEKYYHKGYDQRAQDIENTIANIERQRRAAMEYGGIKSSEITDAEILRDQAILQEKLTAEKERQKELTDEIARLEKEGASSSELGKLGSQLDKTNDNVRRLQMFVDNKDVLMDLMHKAKQDEKAASAMTLDEQKLMYEARKTAAEARLENADERSKKHIEESIARYTNIIADLDTKIADRDAKEREKNDPMNIIANKFAGAIKQALGGNGGLNVDATGLASEATLTQIYEILVGIVQAMGGKVTRDPEKDALLARKRELLAKKNTPASGENKSGDTKAQQTSNERIKNPQAEKIIDDVNKEIKDVASNELPKLIKDIFNSLDAKNIGTEEDTKQRYKLYAALKRYRDENIGIKDVAVSKKDKKGRHTYAGLAEHLGVKGADKEYLYANKVHERANDGFAVTPKVKPNAVAEEVKENTEQTPPTVEVKPEVAKEDAERVKTQLKSIFENVGKDTKGTERTLNGVSNAINGLKNSKGGVKAFDEFKKSLLELKGGKGSLDDVVAKAQKFVEIFAGYSRDRFPDLSKLFGPDAKDGANHVLSIMKQVFELTKDERKLNKANNSQTEVKAAQQVAEAAKAEAAATAQVTEERAEQKAITSSFTKEDEEELRDIDKKLGGYDGPQVDFSDADIGLAQEETLKAILNLITKIQTEGIKKGGSGAKNKKTTKVDEAELIKRRALSNHEAILGLGADDSSIIKTYNNLVTQLEAKVKEVQDNTKAKKSTAEPLKEVKILAQKISAMGFNIMKEASAWDYTVKEADKIGTIDASSTKSVREQMEDLAQTDLNGKQYKFLNFDGKNLSYQLTDIHGNVEKVTMSWSELNNQVAITSDKSVAKLDTLAGKVKTFKDKFENATQMGYLAEDDEAYKKFLDKVADIDTQSTFEDVEKARNEALQLADEVTKKIVANKKLYTGTSEMNAATKQYEHLATGDILDHADLKLVEEYKNQYAALLKLHDDLKSGADKRGLLDETAQKDLLKASLETKRLGKELEKATSNSQRLRNLMDASGSYRGQEIGQEFRLEDNVDKYEVMRAKLEELGATNIKIDKIHQRATGTLRHNSTTVSDLTVEYDELRTSLARYQKQERESLTGLPAFLNGFQKKFNSIMQYLTMTMSIHQVLAQLRRGVQYIKEIDLALTELRKVTDETEATYERFLQTAAKTGERLGSTISAVTQATATFAKLGYTMTQATEMAEAAIVYKNVGDNIASTEDAADSIISTMKGFGLEATESMAIVDKFNEVGNRFAITSQGIGEALRLSASALNEGKNSLDESIALITAANEVVNDPSSVGKQSLPTIKVAITVKI